jgi:hypothetical protein
MKRTRTSRHPSPSEWSVGRFFPAHRLIVIFAV